MFNIFFFIAFCYLICSPTVSAKEATSRYFTLIYTSQHQLIEFNDKIGLESKVRAHRDQKKGVTLEDEVILKLDTIMEKAEIALDMFPDGLHVRVILLETADILTQEFNVKYGKNVEYIAYYSPAEDTIYLAVSEASLTVIVHEIGHAIVERYFEVRPPYKIHELLAQFVEKQIKN